ncbi:MAG TPA: molecular chaperone DnaJ [Candidatus Limnocylindria bacterium]|nr:molecular chaperone DnaJ [Candidatus Limnocylindria bacterium]
MAAKDYYAVLGVPRDATDDQVRSAYRKLARQYHPDVNQDHDAADRFKEITEAYEVLSDADRRQRYDMFGGEATIGFGIDDLFSTFFGGDMRRRDRGPTRGADLRVALEIDLEEAVRGAEKEIGVPRLETCERCDGSGAEPGSSVSTCSTCGGRGEVRQVQQSVFGRFVNVSTCPRCAGSGRTIDKACARCGGEGRERTERRVELVVPAGIDDGQQLRVQGQGEAGLRGGPHGDLYVLVRVKEHRRFRREGDDLVHQVRISPAQAVLGDEVSVPTVDGATATVRIPAGSQHGHVVRLRGKGVPHLGGGGRGDQLVVLNIAIPRTLSKEERRAYEKLRDLRRPADDDVDRGIFDRVKDALGGE